MAMPYFYFKNIISTDYLTIDKLPSITRAAKDIQKIEIEGRDGFLTNDLGSYKSTIKNIECWIKNLDDLDFICSWLTGSGDIIFSNEPDKVYEVTIINQIDFKKFIKEFHKFIIVFECQPKKKSINNPIITLTSAGKIFNSGSVISRPVMKLFGSGSITLTINGINIYLTNVNGYITLDSFLEDAYKELVYKNTDMSGEFPILKVGNNTISWSGSVSKLEITPNLRWL